MSRSRDRGERLPLSAVAPYVQAFVDGYEGGGYVTAEDFKREHPEWGSRTPALGVMFLADKTGIPGGTIEDWLKQVRKGRRGSTIGFFDADALFTAMDCVSVWQRDPVLRELRRSAEATMPETD